jgi:thioredoxin reductase
MNQYDVVIVGGGPAGLSVGLILGSAPAYIEEAKYKKIAIIDSGHSDALRARFFNVAGLPFGISGKDAITQIKEQLNNYDNVEQIPGTVRKVIEQQTDNSNFIIDFFNSITNQKEQITAKTVVLASGFRQWMISGLELPVVPFERSENNTRVSIINQDYKVKENLYVCGLLSGVSSQWNIVAGSGSQVGVHIISNWAGSWKVVHDKI